MERSKHLADSSALGCSCASVPSWDCMGTLIPISPALVGLAQGDVDTLSNNLVIAFSSTVVGLLIGGLAYVITTVRDRFYRQDIVDIEYVFDRRGE